MSKHNKHPQQTASPRRAMIDPQPMLLSTGQAARRLGVGKTKMLELIRGERIACKMLNGRIRVPMAALEAFEAALVEGYVRGRPVAAAALND